MYVFIWQVSSEVSGRIGLPTMPHCRFRKNCREIFRNRNGFYWNCRRTAT